MQIYYITTAVMDTSWYFVNYGAYSQILPTQPFALRHAILYDEHLFKTKRFHLNLKKQPASFILE